MSDLAEKTYNGAGSIGGAGRVLVRIMLGAVLLSPVGVGVLLAPKASDMTANPELAPPPATALPDAARTLLSSRDQEPLRAQPVASLVQTPHVQAPTLQP
jgi:hypothetical protein